MSKATRRRLMDRKVVEMLVRGVKVKAIARELHVSKKRVRRLRALAMGYGYLRRDGKPGEVAVPPFPEALFPDQSDGRSQMRSEEHLKLDAIQDWIKDRLEVGWQPITVFEELPAQAAGIGRSSFYRYLQRTGLSQMGKSSRQVVVEIVHEPGEVLIVDWGKLCDGPDPVTGRKRPVWNFGGVLGYSRLRLVRLVWTMDLETTLRVIEEMLKECGGVVRKVTLDNPKCIALKASPYEAVLNPVAERFAQHYGFFWECLPPARPELKGKIERQVPFLRRLYQPRKGIWEGLEAQEAYLRRKLALANEQLHGTTRRRPKEVFEAEERPVLKPLPPVTYEIEQYHQAIGRKDGYVRFDSRYYGVGEGYRDKEVVVIANSKQVALYHQGRLLELYDRLRGPAGLRAVKPHLLKPWQKTLQDGAFYLQRAGQIGPNVKAWVEDVLKSGQGFVDTRKVWGVLSLDKRYGRQDIDGACKRALKLGSTSYQMVVRMLAIEESLEKLGTQAGGGSSGVGSRPAASYKYAKPAEEYQKLLPLWQPTDADTRQMEVESKGADVAEDWPAA